MPDPLIQTLHDWQPFYQLTGEVAGTLMGLMFVSMSLGSRFLAEDPSAEKRNNMARKIRAFISPTIIHLTSVVVIAAVMCMPLHRHVALSLGLGFVGLAGVLYLVYTLQALRESHRQSALQFDHWMFHFYLPLLCYLAAVATAIAFPFTPDALPGLAVATIFFLVVGIRNSWLSTLYTSGLTR